MPGETIYTVSNVNRYIGRMFENSPVLDRIRVKGEVTECKYHGSGHLYFALKDGQSQLQVALFANRRAGLTFRLEDGMEVVVSGSVRAYEPRGTYSLIATEVKAAGVGALYEQFERMRRGILMKPTRSPFRRLCRCWGWSRPPAVRPSATSRG